MTRWSIPALRCDRCGTEVEERDEGKPLAKEWGTATALATGEGGRARQIGNGVNPADLCGACVDGLFHWYSDPGSEAAPPRPPQPIVQRIRDTLTLDDLSAMSIIIAKAIDAQATAAVEMLREQPSAVLMEPSDPEFPPVLRNLAMVSLRAAREIAVRFDLLAKDDLARLAPKSVERASKEEALTTLIDAAGNGDALASQKALDAFEKLPE